MSNDFEPITMRELEGLCFTLQHGQRLPVPLTLRIVQQAIASAEAAKKLLDRIGELEGYVLELRKECKEKRELINAAASVSASPNIQNLAAELSVLADKLRAELKGATGTQADPPKVVDKAKLNPSFKITPKKQAVVVEKKAKRR